MAKVICGYSIDDAPRGEDAVQVRYGVEEGCIDLGRDENGEVRSFIPNGAGGINTSTQDDVRHESAAHVPRLFDPPSLRALPLAQQSVTSPERGARGTFLMILRERISHLVTRLRFSQQRAWLLGAGGAVVVVFVFLLVPAAHHTDSSVPEASASPSLMSNTEVAGRSDGSDPQNAAIDLALAGAISGLGSMQGIPRNAVTASIASRAGEIVLVDVSVAKPTGLTAFATVLLQKVGTQWRMRQIVDGRN